MKNRQGIFFIISLISTVVCIFWFKSQISPITSDDIIRFELAKSSQEVKDILNSWSDVQQKAFKLSINLDYIFIVFYSLTIYLGCNFLSRKTNNSSFFKLGKVLGIGAIIAGFCDSIENISMTKTLQHIAESTIITSYYMASIKFLLLAICILFMLICLLFMAINKLRK